MGKAAAGSAETGKGAQGAVGSSRGSWLALAAMLACFAAAALATAQSQQMMALVAALTLLCMLLLNRAAQELALWRQGRVLRRLDLLLRDDAAPCFTTDAQGEIRFRNAAAQQRCPAGSGASLTAALRDHFAAPGAVLFRLQSRAGHLGAAREDVVTRQGHLRLSVHRLPGEHFLWRLEEFGDRGPAGRGAESLGLPMLTANKAGVVLFSNEAMRRILGGRPKHLDRIFTGPLRSGEEVELAGAAGPLRALLVEVPGHGERREIYLLPLNDAGPPPISAEFENLPVPMLRFAPLGALQQANRAARDLLHLPPDETPMIHDLFDGLGRPVADWLGDVAAERLPGGAEVLCARPPGPEVFLQVTLRRVVDQGRPSVLAVLQDATALKTLEAQVVQSQKMQAIGQLAGGVAHDFNNLLTAISGHCDLLLLRHDSEDSDFADLTQIHQNANRAAALVNQLLAFSRKQTLKPERLDLQDLLSDLAHLLNRLVGERVGLRLTHAAELGPIRADRRQLEQVILNLVVNARDAMPEGGTIRLETAALHLPAQLCRDRAIVPPGDYAVIKVSDSGCGIPPERLAKIFEPFFTTKKAGEGTGLGLSTAYGIVKQSGGFIFVDSVEGQGSEFQLYFPIHAAPGDLPAPSFQTKRNMVLRQGEGVVLLVEDEAPVRAFASRALRLRGYTVIEAENAEQALQKLEDPQLEVDLFVTDVVMPGLDGPSWVRQALQDRPQVKVIFVSGYAEEALSEEQLRVPNSVFLPKPFSLHDLTRTVQGQLQ